jgi:hypothetical protein
MPLPFKILLPLLCMSFAYAWPQSKKPGPLISKDTSIENERKNTLFVFVGEKISVEELPYAEGDFNMGYVARYKVLQQVYGYYPGDTIVFKAYDHYGAPRFANNINVLLFVSEDSGRYYHEKYQYFDVYKTTDGRWASPYARMDYTHPYNKNTAVRPEKISFAKEVSYPLNIKRNNKRELAFYYPAPYYKIKDGEAIAIYGNYLEDLFRLKKEGVLAARELFENKHANDTVEEVRLEEYRRFMSFWKSFAQSVRKAEWDKVRANMLDSIWAGDSVTAAGEVIQQCLARLTNKRLLYRGYKNPLLNYSTIGADTSGILPCARQRMVKKGKKYIFRTVNVEHASEEPLKWSFYADFIETANGYLLYSCTYLEKE